jgi:class 3 adenylate cyclase
VRASIAPGGLIAEFERFLATDIRAILPAVSAPTLVLVDPEGTDDLDPRNGRLIVDRIAAAQLKKVGAHDSLNWHHWYGRSGRVLDEVQTFLGEIREEEAQSDRVLATVLFTDIVDSTTRGADLGDHGWREVREAHDRAVRAQLARHRGREVKTMGDGFLATFDGPGRAVRAASGIVTAVRPLGIEVRAGLHTGEIELDGDDVAGLAVAIGARVGAKAGPSEVLVSQTVKDLVAGSGLTFEDAGEHDLKGVPDRWRLYRVAG